MELMANYSITPAQAQKVINTGRTIVVHNEIVGGLEVQHMRYNGELAVVTFAHDGSVLSAVIHPGK